MYVVNETYPCHFSHPLHHLSANCYLPTRLCKITILPVLVTTWFLFEFSVFVFYSTSVLLSGPVLPLGEPMACCCFYFKRWIMLWKKNKIFATQHLLNTFTCQHSGRVRGEWGSGEGRVRVGWGTALVDGEGAGGGGPWNGPHASLNFVSSYVSGKKFFT